MTLLGSLLIEQITFKVVLQRDGELFPQGTIESSKTAKEQSPVHKFAIAMAKLHELWIQLLEHAP